MRSLPDREAARAASADKHWPAAEVTPRRVSVSCDGIMYCTNQREPDPQQPAGEWKGVTNANVSRFRCAAVGQAGWLFAARRCASPDEDTAPGTGHPSGGERSSTHYRLRNCADGRSDCPVSSGMCFAEQGCVVRRDGSVTGSPGDRRAIGVFTDTKGRVPDARPQRGSIGGGRSGRSGTVERRARGM